MQKAGDLHKHAAGDLLENVDPQHNRDYPLFALVLGPSHPHPLAIYHRYRILWLDDFEITDFDVNAVHRLYRLLAHAT